MTARRSYRTSAVQQLVAALIGTAFCASASPAQTVTLFADDFDAGTSGMRWTLFDYGGDYSADYAYDYSARGIPSAPNSTGGSTVGLRLEVNNNDEIEGVDAVSLYPTGYTFTGDQTLKFDMWMNYNGGAGGGGGSTEFATGGLAHAGTRVVWQYNAASDGRWFAVTGEGGALEDYRVYRNAALLSVAAGGYAAVSQNSSDVFYQDLFPSPTYETAGAPGKHWVEVEISYANGVVEWRLNGRLIAADEETTLTSGAIMLGYMDPYTSVADVRDDNFVIFDNVRVESPDCDANGVADDAEVAAGSTDDCNANGRPDACEVIDGGDLDHDGDVDADDYAGVADCLVGPAGAPAPNPPLCVAACLAAFDANDDGRIDLRDFAAFQEAFTTGPIPPRQAGAPTGSQFIAETGGMGYAAREPRVIEEVLGGNVPGFLRNFIPVTVNANIGGNPTTATYYVTCDYLAIGTDDDFVRMPMTPLIAQPIADAFDCLLPTRRMVDQIWAAATVKLSPSPISPSVTDIRRTTTFYRHHQTVEAQRAGQPLGLLIAGIKKDVVITPQLATHPNNVAIYGWHYLNGTPIQPLYLGHVDFYADYSHGIRLVKKTMLVNGVPMATADVLADPDLNVLLSDEGPVTNPSY
jgi:hypothetical protein